MKKKNLLFLTIFFLLTITLYLSVAVDPDFGFHLATGHYIWENHTIPQKDIFTFTMPDYPYVYHSWLTEVLLYLVYRYSGLWGISLFYSLIVTIGFWLITQITKKRLKTTKSCFLIILFALLANKVVGLRTQCITFLGLTILYYIYEKTKYRPKKQLPNLKLFWIVPPLFVIWANAHGGFILGFCFFSLLVVFQLFDIYRSFLPASKKKQLYQFLIFIVTISALATLLTPYGIRAHQQAVLMATNGFSVKYNHDWLPLFDARSQFQLLGTVFTIFSLLAILYGRKTSWEEKVLIGLFYFLALQTKRYLLPLLIILIPQITPLLETLLSKFKTKDFITNLPIYISATVAILLLTENRLNTLEIMNRAYSSKEYFAQATEPAYPYGAMIYMKEYGFPERMLNEYGWGGYLIWHFPDKKIGLDGRMDTFFINGKPFAQEAREIATLKPNWQELMTKYQIRAVLAPPEWPLVQALKLQSNWEILFEDEVSVLLQLREI
ncbi:hypothetical protein KJ596_02325 [Patescibacteria group bacterium]|nr:hypothetical protein [Patescibacteria group bacterium]MBU1868627.1 hypothetical protein [Patescibacteria group bacterium]